MSGPQNHAQVGEAVRLARGPLTQKQVAALMRDRGFQSWEQQTVMKVEGGTRNLLYLEALALRDVLGVEIGKAESDTTYEVYKHLAATVGGINYALCGKVWRSIIDSRTVVVGECPECANAAETEWVS